MLNDGVLGRGMRGGTRRRVFLSPKGIFRFVAHELRRSYDRDQQVAIVMLKTQHCKEMGLFYSENRIVTVENWCNDCRERSTTWFILGYGLRYTDGRSCYPSGSVRHRRGTLGVKCDSSCPVEIKISCNVVHV